MKLYRIFSLYTLLAIIALGASSYKIQSPFIKDKPTYTEFKKNVTDQKGQLNNHPSKDIGNYLFNLINDDIYDYWAGTMWEFHGETRQPKAGSIACGYFVTTTLTDLGFKIDRVALAECRSGDMIKRLCTHIHSFNSFDNFSKYLTKQPVNSVYIVGLDFHTGYIIKTAEGCYFLNSSYYKKQVVKEKIEVSADLLNNKFFMIGSLTANDNLLRKWLGDTPII